MGNKPRLPREIEVLFPSEIVTKIYKYVPKLPKRPNSPSLQRELERIQKSPKRTPMDLYGLDDFVLN
jgi:hypothetical protein